MRRILIFNVCAALLLFSGVASAEFISGSTGADGEFHPTENTVRPLPEDGVFNFSTVTIPQGVTVTFTKNDANTPVYILATGDVTIAGTINVNGGNGIKIQAGVGGPGGFDGGKGGASSSSGGGGLGPGGGSPGIWGKTICGGGGAGYAAQGDASASGTAGGPAYGNEDIIPAMGGSGGGGGRYYVRSDGCSDVGGGGGGGGGAILIASSGTINVTGTISANGGKGGSPSYCGACGGGGGGSGGAIKLIANAIKGNGILLVNKGVDGFQGGQGAQGRIRFEANNITISPSNKPAYTSGYPISVFRAEVPALRIASIGGVAVPEKPLGKYETPDMTLPSATTNPVTITVSASNVPVGTQVEVSAIPEHGGVSSGTGSLSGSEASSSTSVGVNLSNVYRTIVVAQADFIVQVAMFYEGEKIERVRVASKLGQGSSDVTYITTSGKEIPRAELMAKLIK